MINIPEFRGMPIKGGNWIYGFLDYRTYGTCFAIHEVGDIPPTSANPGGDVYSEYKEVAVESIGQFTGIVKPKFDRKIFDGDIFFEEIENDMGDDRLFCIVTWVPELAQFCMLNYGEWLAYSDNGIGGLDEFEDYGIHPRDLKKMHYYGTLFEHGEKLKTIN